MSQAETPHRSAENTAPSNAGKATPSPSPQASPTSPGTNAHGATPLPSLKPGEVITWVKLDRPRFAIGEIIVSSFTIVGVVVLAAVAIGMLLGQLRSKRGGAHGTGSLHLR